MLFPVVVFVAVVEYIGVLEHLETVHGHSQRNNVPYKRINPDVMEHAAKELAAMKPRQIYVVLWEQMSFSFLLICNIHCFSDRSA
jgi:hypothetical protein